MTPPPLPSFLLFLGLGFALWSCRSDSIIPQRMEGHGPPSFRGGAAFGSGIRGRSHVRNFGKTAGAGTTCRYRRRRSINATSAAPRAEVTCLDIGTFSPIRGHTRDYVLILAFPVFNGTTMTAG